MLVTSSWTHPTLIIDLEVLWKWGIISVRFPLPLENRVLSVEEQPPDVVKGKSVKFVHPPWRINSEPDYWDASAMASVLHDLCDNILSDFAPAFSANLLSTQVADVPPVHIQLRDPSRKPHNRKLCKPLPYNLLGVAKQLIDSLVKSSVPCQRNNIDHIKTFIKVTIMRHSSKYIVLKY